MNDNFFVKVYELDKQLIQKIDSMVDSCVREFHDKYFHTFDHM